VASTRNFGPLAALPRTDYAVTAFGLRALVERLVPDYDANRDLVGQPACGLQHRGDVGNARLRWTAAAEWLDRGLAHKLFGGGKLDLNDAFPLEQSDCRGEPVLSPCLTGPWTWTSLGHLVSLVRTCAHS
jgi:hypothetical protein